MNHGFAFHHSSDLEALIDKLIARLGRLPRSGPLEPVTIVVSHPGLGRWLSLQIARRQGIAANFRFEMPAQFVWRWARENISGLPDQSLFDVAALTWPLYAVMGAADPGPLAAYLARDDESSLKQYQLARSLADVLAGYALQRPDWLIDWSHDRCPPDLRGDPDEAWQRSLYLNLEKHVLATGAESPSLALRKLRDWIAHVADGEKLCSLPDHAFVFGVSYLPQLFLDFFAALAFRRPVDLYFLNPSREYWESGVSERSRLRRDLRELRAGRETLEEALFEIDHPLLATLGRHGATFVQRLMNLDLPETLAEADEPGYPLGRGGRLLDAVHASLRDLDAGRLAAAGEVDRSIQIHICHSPLREIQILYDRILGMLDDDPTLRPRDILVLAPDIHRYGPYVRAVFGSTTDRDDLPSIPINLSDRSPVDTHPLVASFSRLLDLPGDDFEVDEIIAVAEVPAVARRFGLDEGRLAGIRKWLVDSGVRWGLDAKHRGRRGGAEEPYGSWQYGLDRMLTGYAMDTEALVGKTVLPLTTIEGQSADSVGRLGWMVRALAEVRDEMLPVRQPAQWVGLIRKQILDGLFRIDPSDPEERGALQHVLDALDRFRRDTAAIVLDDALPWQVVRDHLRNLLREVPRRQAFLSGGVTFANMVPMRSIPARVVCLLGMDDAAFPRRSTAAQFDLTARHPRLGDRYADEEDRYLFLESLLSARDIFYLSYVGAGSNDGEQREPSPLIKELVAFCGADRVLTVSHPMQPFSRRAFAPDRPEIQSPQARWMPAAGASRSTDRARPYFQSPGSLPSPAEVDQVEVTELLRFFRHPVRHYLENQLSLYLRDSEPGLEGDDPLEPGGLESYRLRCRLMDLAMANGGQMPPGLPDPALRAGGDVPPGAQGDREIGQVAQELEPFAAWLQDHAAAGATPPAMPVEVEIAVPSGPRMRIYGDLEPANHLETWHPGAMSAVRVSTALIAHLLAAAAGIESTVRCYGFRKGKLYRLELQPFGEALWRPWLVDLVDLYRRGQSGPLPLYPRSSLAFQTAVHAGKPADGAVLAALQEWRRYAGGGEAEDPYNALLTRGWSEADIFGPDFQTVARRFFQPLLDLQQGKPWQEEKLA